MSPLGHTGSHVLDVEFHSNAACDTERTSLHSNLQRGATLTRKRPQGIDPDLPKRTLEQSFWKFHLIRFGPSMYLTTNPSPRHLHCRTLPGYFIRMEGSNSDYTMMFEDIETGELLVTVQKCLVGKRSEFLYTLHKLRLLHDGAVVNVERSNHKDSLSMSSQNSEYEGNSNLSENDNLASIAPNFQGVFIRKPITGEMIPAAAVAPQINLQGQMMDGTRWSVGSIPRVRDSRLRPNEVRYINKLNVYFHCKAESLQVWKGEHLSQVKAVFRECATKTTKRLLRQINRLLRVPSAAESREPYRPFEDINYYLTCGDGLYYDEDPADDEPDHRHKFGWLTVYEDPMRYRIPGFFDVVVALTVATSQENLC